jgi:hypothetical protein
MNQLKNLPAERPLPHADERRLLLERQVTGASPAGSRRRFPVRMVVAATGVSVLLVGGTAAASFVAFRAPSQPPVDGTRCYTVASLEGGDDFAGTTVARATAADSTRTDAAAVELCADLWRQGFLRAGAPGLLDPTGGATDLPVPPLTACTLDNGIAAVFPGDEHLCTSLGLPRLAE